MFGLGNILGSVFGGFFDSIGMGWMTNVLSFAANAMTGNWVAAAKDVFDLVSEFSNNSSWMDSTSPFQPLGEFGNNGCFGRSNLSSSWLDDIFGRANDGGFELSENVERSFSVLGDTLESSLVVEANRRNVYSVSYA
jgi:hypothetical protein